MHQCGNVTFSESLQLDRHEGPGREIWVGTPLLASWAHSHDANTLDSSPCHKVA